MSCLIYRGYECVVFHPLCNWNNHWFFTCEQVKFTVTVYETSWHQKRVREISVKTGRRHNWGNNVWGGQEGPLLVNDNLARGPAHLCPPQFQRDFVESGDWSARRPRFGNDIRHDKALRFPSLPLSDREPGPAVVLRFQIMSDLFQHRHIISK